MSWLYLPVSAVEYSGRVTCSDGGRSAMLSGTSTRSKSSRRGSKTGTCTTRRYGTTHLRSTGDRGLDWWMSCLRDSRANRSAMQESNLRETTRATGGLPRSESFARYDRKSHGWRTSQASFMESTVTLTPFSGTWPRQGTVLNGDAFQRRKLERRIEGSDSGYWSTPRAGNPGSRPNGKGGKVLAEEVKKSLLPTPISGRSTWMNSHGRKAYTLAGMAKHQMWPTPTAQDADNSTLPASQVTRDSLVGAIMRKYPTPQATSWGSTGSRSQLQTLVDSGTITEDENRKMSAGNGGQLNPNWVEWLMGWPIGWSALEPLGTDRFQMWLRGRIGD